MKIRVSTHIALATLTLGCMALPLTRSHAGIMSPSDISGLQLWLDAQDIQGNGTATTGGQSIATWMDKSGNNNHATSTVSDVDTFVFGDGTLNNGAVLRMNGSNYFQAPVNISRNVMPDVTVIAVYDYRAVNGNEGLWGNDNGGFDRFALLNHSSVSEGISHGTQMFHVDELDQVGGGFDILTTVLDAGVANGSEVRINGSFPTLGGVFTESIGNAGSANLALGTIGPAGFSAQVDVAEFLVYDRLLTASELNDVGFFLGEKYAIATTFVPEPSTFGMLALGGMALWMRKRRRG